MTDTQDTNTGTTTLEVQAKHENLLSRIHSALNQDLDWVESHFKAVLQEIEGALGLNRETTTDDTALIDENGTTDPASTAAATDPNAVKVLPSDSPTLDPNAAAVVAGAAVVDPAPVIGSQASTQTNPDAATTTETSTTDAAASTDASKTDAPDDAGAATS